jgi:hypothetical protein
VNGRGAIAILITVGLFYFVLIRLLSGSPSTVPAVVSDESRPLSAEDDKDSSSPEDQEAKDEDQCTTDCSGHEAGYNWAEEHGIDVEADCDHAEETSNSPSFGEGCRAYVRENSVVDSDQNHPQH